MKKEFDSFENVIACNIELKNRMQKQIEDKISEIKDEIGEIDRFIAITGTDKSIDLLHKNSLIVGLLNAQVIINQICYDFNNELIEDFK